MRHAISIENLETIETSLRRRLKHLDEERKLLELEIKFISGVLDQYGEEKGSQVRGIDNRPLSPAELKPVREMPWGRHASGVEKVIYVVREAGTRGLSRLEVIDRVEEISGERQELNSVTTWLYRAKKRGQIRNRQRRWYANPDRRIARHAS